MAGTRLLLDAPECLQHGDKLRPKSRRVMLRLVAILAVGCRSVEEGNARTSQRHNQGCGELGRTPGFDWVGEPCTFCQNLPKFDSRRVLSDCVRRRRTFDLLSKLGRNIQAFKTKSCIRWLFLSKIERIYNHQCLHNMKINIH